MTDATTTLHYTYTVSIQVYNLFSVYNNGVVR